MRTSFLAVALALPLLASPAVADEPVSAAQAEQIQAALAVWGCEGGTMEREPEVDHYEVDDADCATGEYDVKLDGNFNVILIHAH